jgi:hypothetical protein
MRSAVSLRECGAYVYSLDPTTQVLCLVYAIDDGDPQLWLPTDPPPPVFLEIARDPGDWQLIAHNYEFERTVLENNLIPRHGFKPIPIEIQHCTPRLALANAYPAELDLLAQALGLPYRRDPVARKAMLAVSRPKTQRKRKATTVPLWDEDPAKLQLLYERCKLDVITTRAVWQSPKLHHLTETERRHQLQDAAVNGCGVRLDRTFAAAARDLAIRERTAVNLKLQGLTHDPRSDDEIKAIIKQWRNAHPTICKFWKDLARAIRVTVRTNQPILVAPAPQPPIVAAFVGGNLTLRLPSGRAITYPEARLVPGKFEDAPPDVQFLDNARGQWKTYRGGSAPSSRTSFRAPPEICSPPRSTASRRGASMSCSIATMK